MCPATAETWEAVTYEAILDGAMGEVEQAAARRWLDAGGAGSRPSTSAPKTVTVHLAHDARVFDEESALWQRTSKKEAEEAAAQQHITGEPVRVTDGVEPVQRT